MPKIMKWLTPILLLMIIATSTLAGAVWEHTILMPMIINDPIGTETPTPTQSATVTITPTATITGTIYPTATRTRTPTTGPKIEVNIVDIYYNPTSGPLDEYVSIKNTSGRDVDMTGWTLRDDSKNTYTFPVFTLKHLATVKVWTKSGTNDSGNLYWGSSVSIWNDHGDCAYLRNELNEKIDSYCY